MRRLGPGIALIAALAWIYRHLFRGELLAGRDVLRLAYPDAHFLLHCLRNGELPLWIPNVFLGQPFAATLQAQAFYPPRVLFTVLFGPYWGVSLLQPLHAGLAAWGVFAAARALGRSRLAAALAGGAFGLSPLFTELSGTPNLVSAAAWSGFLLAAAVRASSWRSVGTLAAWVALSALAGSPETVLWQGLVTTGVVGLLRRRQLVKLTAGWVWGAALAAVVLLPALELAGHTSRAQGRGSHLDWSASWPQLAALVWPHADQPRGAYWGEDQWLLLALFVGTTTGMLALASVGRRHRAARALAVLTGILLLLALGRHFALSEWVLSLPGLRTFRYPAKALVGAAFCLSLTAAFGLDRLRALARRGELLRRLRLGLSVTWGTAVGVMAFRGLPSASPAGGGGLWVLGVLTVGTLAVLAWPRGPRRHRHLAGAVGGLAALELLVFHAAHVGTSLARVERLAAPSGLAPLAEGGRISVDFRPPPTAAQPTGAPSDVPAAAAPPASAPVPEQIEVIRGLDSFAEESRRFLLPNRFVEEGLLALEGYGAPEPPRIQEFQLARVQPFYDLAGVALYLRADGPPFPGLADVTPAADGPHVSRSTTAMPRAFLVHQARTLASDEEVLRAINQPGQPARHTVFFTAPAGEFAGSTEEGSPERAAPCTGSSARLTASGANFVEVTASACATGHLVVSDAYFPGWTVEVDDQQVPLLRANHVMRAVRVEPGTHRVLFRYRPWTFTAGATLTLLASALLLATRRFRWLTPDPTGASAIPPHSHPVETGQRRSALESHRCPPEKSPSVEQ